MLRRKRIWINRFGEASNLILKEEEISQELEDDEVLLDVHFSGINFADLIMRQGLYQDAPKRPFVPGYECSGVILKVGAKVTRFNTGDKVLAGCLFGGYSSHLKIREKNLIGLPEDVSLEEGASLPVAFFTAHVALNEMGRVRSGDKVLIDCASGGLGSFCLAMLKEKNVEIVGLTSSPKKTNQIQSYGAKAMTHIDFYSDSSENNFDLIINSLGGKSVNKHFKRLKKTGRLICLGISEGIEKKRANYLRFIKTILSMPWFPILTLFNHNKGVFALNVLHVISDEKFLMCYTRALEKFLTKKKFPKIDKVFSFREIAKAHEYIEEGKSAGKILISWRKD